MLRQKAHQLRSLDHRRARHGCRRLPGEVLVQLVIRRHPEIGVFLGMVAQAREPLRLIQLPDLRHQHGAGRVLWRILANRAEGPQLVRLVDSPMRVIGQLRHRIGGGEEAISCASDRAGRFRISSQ
jgi:hypothetical protein